MNPMQVETPKTLAMAFLNALNYLKTCFFFLFSICLLIVTTVFGFESLLELSTNVIIQLSIVISLMLLSIFFIRLDLRKWRASREPISRAFRISMLFFIFILVYTDVIHFVLEMFEIGLNSWGTDEARHITEHLFNKSDWISFISIFWYPIFFNGKELSSWIRKRDKKIDDYESQFYLITK